MENRYRSVRHVREVGARRFRGRLFRVEICHRRVIRVNEFDLQVCCRIVRPAGSSAPTATCWWRPDLPVAEYRAALIAAGLPEPYAALLADTDVEITRGALDTDSDDLRRLIGRPTISLADAVAAAALKN